MKLEIDVVSSVNIKRKKPWPKLAWIGKGQEGLYLLDGRRVSQLYVPSGKTKKKVAKLHSLMNDACALNVSQCGQYLIGILCEGKVFLWEKDKDILRFITGLPKLFNSADKGSAKNKIFLSSCGNFLLLMVGLKKLFVWQKDENLFVTDDIQDISGTWCQIHHGDYPVPDISCKETSVDGVFFYDHVVGSCGALSYVFNQGTNLTTTTLVIKYHCQTSRRDLAYDLTNQDDETASREVTEKTNFSIKWRSFARPLYGLTPATRLVKGRFVYVCRYSPDGQVLAIVLNQKCAKDTRLVFCSPIHETITIADLKCCGGSEQSTGRMWWISEIVWTLDSLLLLGVTRNGSLFITSKLGEPINLVTSGCMMEMGPRPFLSLHPRISVRSFQENIPPDTSEISSGSEKDIFHQKFSVAVHPRLPVFLCSDGYIVTILQFTNQPDHVEMMTNLIEEVSNLIPKGRRFTEHMATTCNIKKLPVDQLKYSDFLPNVTPPSDSSPGSTLSTTTPGFGIASNVESGVISFGEMGTPAMIEIEPMTDQEKCMKAKHLLLQALGIGTCCGPYWSADMTVAMNLVIHAWAKLFLCLLESECEVQEKTVSFGNIISVVQSALEIFRWDMSYQHCLPWLSQVASSTVKTLVTFNKLNHKEVISISLRLLQMVETYLNQIYPWCALSNRSTVHLLGDSFSPICNAPSTIIPTSNLDGKLERSWLVLHSYVCKTYLSSNTPDQQLVQNLCFIQGKLQSMNSLRNLVSINKMDSPLDQGQKLYLEGKSSQAVNLLKKSVDDNFQNGKSAICEQTQLEVALNFDQRMVGNEVNTATKVDMPLLQDSSLQLTIDVDTLLTILYIHLGNYDLKASLALVYSFINTNRSIDVEDLLITGASVEKGPLLFAADGSQTSIASASSPSVQLQLLLLTRYPLVWITDICALTVVQHLARFMCCYFTNLPLTIPMPFQFSQSTLHEENPVNEVNANSGNLKNLLQQKVTEAVAEQKLEHCWTADHAIELLIVSGLLGEAAWFSDRLGDWKIAFFLSVLQQFHERRNHNLYSLPRIAYFFPPPREAVEPKKLMLSKIKLILHMNDDWVCEFPVDGAGFSVDEHIVETLNNAFQASVVAGLDLVPEIIESLLNVLVEKIRKLDWMVTQDLYLPAPPLYCPQPTRNEEEIIGEEMRRETLARHGIAKVVQKILAVYRSSNCFLFCVQEYCNHVALRLSNEESNILPSVIKEFLTSTSFRFDKNTAGHDDAESTSGYAEVYPEAAVRILRSFQQFCGLMWLLHVRDNVSITSRAYSKLKQNMFAGPGDDHQDGMTKKCQEVLESLKSMLPFSDFLNAVDHIQDGMLTLLAELPLTVESVDMLAEYFHTPPSSLSLSTMDKLKRLTRRLRNISAPVETGNEVLFGVFQKKCEERRTPRKNDQTNYSESGVFRLDGNFEYCNSLGYEENSEYVGFLDTFLLIAVSKNINKSSYEEIPLIQCCAKQLELVELSRKRGSGEQLPMVTERETNQSPGIQRSQSLHDVRSKVRLFAPIIKNEKTQSSLQRSNSLTDVTKDENSKLSRELQAMLPRFIWLQKWCFMEESERGNQRVNKGISLLNGTSFQAAIRVQVSIKMILNTLWLMENYYKEFLLANGRCVKGKRLQKKSRKRSKPTSVSTSPQKIFEKPEKSEMLQEPTKETDQERHSGTTSKQSGLQDLEKTKCEEAVKKPQRAQYEGTERNEKRNVFKEREREALEKQRCQVLVEADHERQQSVKHEVLEGRKIGKQKFDATSDEVSAGEMLPSNELKQVILDKSSKKHVRPSRKMKKAVGTPLFIRSKEQPSIVVEDFDSGDKLLEIASVPETQKKLFPSSLSSSSIDNQNSELVKDELPLLSLDYSPTVSENNEQNDYSVLKSREMVRTSGLVTDDSESHSSESLSVGQIRGEFVRFRSHESTYNTVDSNSTSVSKMSKRKSTRKKMSVETSSHGDSDHTTTKSKDEAGLLRRIIRSEMRKFIRSQQAQIKSQSSAVDTTEDEILRQKSSKDQQPSILPLRKKKSDRINSQKAEKARLQKSQSISNSNTTVDGVLVEAINNSNNGREFSDEQFLPVLNNGSDHHASNDDGRTDVHGYSNRPSQVPTTEQPYPMNRMSEWPFWFQTPFPVAPPWLWSNTANKANDDKGVQVSVDSSAVLHDMKQDDKRTDEAEKVNKASMTTSANGIEQNRFPEIWTSKMSHVSVQTDFHEGNEENSAAEKHVKESRSEFITKSNKLDITGSNSNDVQSDRPRLFQLDADEGTINATGVSRAEYTLPHNTQRGNERNISETSHNEKGIGLSTPETSSGYNVQDNKPRDGNLDDVVTIPLLKIPTELLRCPTPELPFKIAWPDKPLETETTDKGSEMLLLELGNVEEQPMETEFVPFSAPVANFRNMPNFPLLNLGQQDCNLENFRFLDVSVNQNFQLPLLHLPEAQERRFSLPATILETGDEQSTTKRYSVATETQEDIPSNSNDFVETKTPTARVKRRQLLKDTPKKFTQSIGKKVVAEHTSSESRSSGVEPSVVTVQPVPKTNSDRTKKTTKRREKLRELNNIIRDLEHEISDEGDLVLSEVSNLLSEDVKYEHFERRPKRTFGSITGDVPSNKITMSSDVGKKWSKISNIHKSSTTTARDIHSEYPLDVSLEALSSDAKVGTVSVPRFPVSVQTDDIVHLPGTSASPRKDLVVSVQTDVCLPDTSSNAPKALLPASVQTDVPHENFTVPPVRLETREFSVQTEVNETSKEVNRPMVFDAAMNTEKVSLVQEETTAKAVYPRVPSDVYLDVNEDVSRHTMSSTKLNTKVDNPSEEARMFISVANIGQDALQRKFEEQPAPLVNDREPKKKYSTKQEEEHPKGDDLQANTSLPENDANRQGDSTTVDMFSSSPPPRVPFHISNEKQAQKIAKETVSQKFQEMNDHFEVIDRLASNMDRELQRSNMLLRTIDNLHQVSDNVNSCQDDDLLRTEETQTPALAVNDHIEDKEPIWRDPPWTNKPIKELTQLRDHHDADANKLDGSVDDENDGSGNSRYEITASSKIAENDEEDVSKEETPRSFTSTNLSEQRQSEYAKMSLQSRDQTPRSQMTSLVPQNMGNISKDKLKDLLNSVTTSDSRLREKTPQKQKELQEWMSKKRKMRHKQWKAVVNEKREAEHTPFHKKAVEGVVSTKKIKKAEKEREDTRRAQKKEYINERLMSAYGLMNELIEEPLPKQPPSPYTPSRNAQRKKTKKVARVKANNRYKHTNISNKKPPMIDKVDEEDFHGSATLYDYDIEESGKRFITRKSYELYQNKMSGSFDFSAGKNDTLRMSYDSRVDELLDDVSLSETIDEAKLDHLDSLLNGDSELRELLSDVIVTRPRALNEDSMNSGLSSNVLEGSTSDRWRTRKLSEQVIVKGGHHRENKYSSEIVDDWENVDNFEVSDEVAALLAEAKAAIGDDFSGTSEVEDIDWNEVDNVLQEN